MSLSFNINNTPYCDKPSVFCNVESDTDTVNIVLNGTFVIKSANPVNVLASIPICENPFAIVSLSFCDKLSFIEKKGKSNMSNYLKLDGDDSPIKIKTAYENGGRLFVVVPGLTLSAMTSLKSKMTVSACSTLRLVDEFGQDVSEPFIGYQNQTDMEIVQSIAGADPLFEARFTFEKNLTFEGLSEKLSSIPELEIQIEQLQTQNLALSEELTATQVALVEEFESRIKLQQRVDLVQ